MPFDLALDFNTGDLMVAPNKDLEVRTGLATIEQRIRVRLRIWQGQWPLDYTGGTLGSTLHDVTRMPVWRATSEIPLIVKEALEPMSDISVTDVVAVPDDKQVNSVNVTITYAILDDGQPGEEQTLAFNTTIAG